MVPVGSKTKMVRLSKEQIDEKLNFIKNYISANNAADGSTFDPNSNVTNKNVATMLAELNKDFNIQVQRAIIYNRLKEMFNDDVADKFISQLEKHEIYCHDETAPLPYCVAISMYPFLLNGLADFGGEATPPKHLSSFNGEFINLIYAIASQFCGACLYKDQKLIIKTDGKIESIKSKDLVERYTLDKSFYFQNELWEYADISDKNVFVAEDGKLVKVNKVYRRKYKDKIYKITTHGGKCVSVSKDHKFKQLYKTREFESKANTLKLGDTLFASYDYSYLIDKNSDDYKIGQCLGIIARDSSISYDTQATVSVNTNQAYIMNFLDKNLHLLGIETVGTRNQDNRGNVFSYYIGSTNAVKKIRSYFSGDSFNTHNRYIDLSDKSLNFKLGYLDGLMVTNETYSKSHSMSITLTNESLINSVKEVLEDLFIFKNIVKIDPKRENRKTLYRIQVPLKLLKYLELTPKKPTLSSVIAFDSRSNHINQQEEVYYVGTNFSKFNSNSIKCCNKAKVNIKTDVIDSIDCFDNDDEYVYEIETETHWYNCGGLITHNCATVEYLTYFDHFAAKDYGEDYLNTHTNIIKQELQQTVYALNQPASARNYQSVN